MVLACVGLNNQDKCEWPVCVAMGNGQTGEDLISVPESGLGRLHTTKIEVRQKSS